MQLVEKLARMGDEVKQRKERHAALRERLLADIAGADVRDRTKCSFKNVPLRQLVRMKVNASQIGGGDRVSFATLVASRAAKVSGGAGDSSGSPANTRRPPQTADSTASDAYNDEFDEPSQASDTAKAAPESRIAIAEREIRRLKRCRAVPCGGQIWRCVALRLFRQSTWLHIAGMRNWLWWCVWGCCSVNARLQDEENCLLEEMGGVDQRNGQIQTLQRQAATFSSNFERERDLRLRAEDERLAVQEKVWSASTGGWEG